MRIAAVATTLFCLFGSFASANVLTNPNFDTDLSGWRKFDKYDNFPMAWDASGASAPGSVKITMDRIVPQATSQGGSAVLMQCISVSAGQFYQLGAKAFIPAAQSSTSAAVSVIFFSNGTCGDGNTGAFGDIIAPGGGGSTSTIGSWVPLAGGVFIPGVTNSVQVKLSVGKKLVDPQVTAYFDDVFFTQAPAPQVIIGKAAEPIIQAAGASGGTTAFTLVNVGGSSTELTLRAEANGTISDTAVSLGPGGSQTVTITATASSGLARVYVDGLGASLSFEVPITTLTPPVQAVTATPVDGRVDVASTGSTATGEVRFKNNGSVALTGVLVSDVPWISVTSSPVTIQAGTTQNFPFSISRAERPDAQDVAGSIAGRIRLVYASGTNTLDARAPFADPGLAVAVVTVVDTAKPTTSDSLIPPLTPGEISLAIPGIGNVTGSVGVFISDISIGTGSLNTAVSDLRLYYVPSNGSTSTTFTPHLSAGQSLALADIVNTVFNQLEQIGTLHLRSKDAALLGVSASVFNKSNIAGTYGTAIPVFRSDRAITSGQRLTLTGLRKNATSHTNLYLQEMQGSSASAQITFYDAAGTSLSTITQGVAPFGLAVIGQASVPEGSISAQVTNTSGGALVAFATPVDRASGDTWAVTDWNLYNGLTGAEAMEIPVAGSAPGRNNTYFRTDLSITNIGDTPASGTLRFYQQIPSVTSVETRVTLARDASAVLEDVLTSTFNLPAPVLGHLVFVPDPNALFAVTSRTYTTVQGDVKTFGTGVPTLSSTAGITAGGSKTIGGLKDSTAATTNALSPGTFRTNLGLVEGKGESLTVRVSVLFTTGYQLALGGSSGSLTLTLAPREFRQMNAILSAILGSQIRETTLGDLDNVQVKVEALSGNGSVFVYVTLTDNGSGDTVLRTD